LTSAWKDIVCLELMIESVKREKRGAAADRGLKVGAIPQGFNPHQGSPHARYLKALCRTPELLSSYARRALGRPLEAGSSECGRRQIESPFFHAFG
jgi:hypothetical protein